MSRTYNTAPLRVQAFRVPRWAATVRHSSACAAGGACDLDNPDLSDRRWHRDGCWQAVKYYRGCHGGSRRGQSMYADDAEAEVRARLRARLRAATRFANTHPGGCDVCGELVDVCVCAGHDDFDIVELPRSTAWWIH